jgi:hypothetical protein
MAAALRNRAKFFLPTVLVTGTDMARAAAAERDQLANRLGLRAARQINHWRRHGESAFGEKMSDRSMRSSDRRTGATGRNAGSAC